MLRSLGIEVDLPTKHYGDNKSVHESYANENAECKSSHSSVCYHKMRESVVAVIITPYHVYSEGKIADMLTKPLRIETHNNLTNRVLK